VVVGGGRQGVWKAARGVQRGTVCGQVWEGRVKELEIKGKVWWKGRVQVKNKGNTQPNSVGWQRKVGKGGKERGMHTGGEQNKQRNRC